MSMLTDEEKLGFIRDLNMMNQRIELSDNMIKDAEKKLEEMKENHKVMVQLRDFYAEILKSMDEA